MSPVELLDLVWHGLLVIVGLLLTGFAGLAVYGMWLSVGDRLDRRREHQRARDDARRARDWDGDHLPTPSPAQLHHRFPDLWTDTP